MCLDCWEEEGRPWMLTDAVRQWSPVFRDVDHYGKLHVVVEDWNLDDDNIRACMTSPLTIDEHDLCVALLIMSVGERWATAIRSDDPDFHPQVI